MLSDIKLGWLAGIVDGEGCIGSYWSNKKREVGGSLCIYVQVEACSETMVLHICGLLTELDVSFYYSGAKPRKNMRSSFQVLIKKKSEVLKLLRIIAPLLIVKKQEAEIGISFFEKWNGDGYRTLAPKSEKLAVFAELKRLKKDGVIRRWNPLATETIPSQAAPGNGSAEGVETRL